MPLKTFSGLGTRYRASWLRRTNPRLVEVWCHYPRAIFYVQGVHCTRPEDGEKNRRWEKEGREKTGIAALYPERGPWQRLEVSEILPLATGKSDKVEILADGKRWKLGRIDAIKALSKVRGTDVEMAYETLVDAWRMTSPMSE